MTSVHVLFDETNTRGYATPTSDDKRHVHSMAATTFTQFTNLPKELRIPIWLQAIATQVQDIADGLPRWFCGGWAERRRQAILGYDTLPSSQPKRFLRVYIRDPYEGRKMLLEEDDFETFINCLPISAVSRESRTLVAEFCRTLAVHMEFEYTTSNLLSLEPPEDGAEPVLLRDALCNPAAETLEHFYAQPTTLTVLGRRGEFKSPKHLVDMVNRFFGEKIERLILELWIESGDPQERPYWSDSLEVPEDM